MRYLEITLEVVVLHYFEHRAFIESLLYFLKMCCLNNKGRYFIFLAK